MSEERDFYSEIRELVWEWSESGESTDEIKDQLDDIKDSIEEI